MKYEKPVVKVILSEQSRVRDRGPGGVGGASNSGCGMCKVFK